MESPPRSKKLSRTPTRLIPSCSAQMAASRVCVSPSGATNALVSNAASGGGGSRFRAVFPAEFKGMESRLISAWGIMYSGTISRSAVFISLTSGELPGAGTMYPTRRWTPGTSSRPIAAALAILHDEYREPPTIRQLARRVGSNECTLKRTFKAHTGSTIAAYIRAYRLHIALDLLADGADADSVSAQIGYESPAYFRRLFASHYGYKP